MSNYTVGFADRTAIRDGLRGYLRWRKSQGLPVDDSTWLERINREMERNQMKPFSPKKAEAEE